MKSSVFLSTITISVVLGPDEVDRPDVEKKLRALPGSMCLGNAVDNIYDVTFDVPTGTNLAAYEKVKARQIGDIIAGAERRAQRKVNAEKQAAAKPVQVGAGG